MSIEILDCLKRKRDICVKAVITSQITAFTLTPVGKEKPEKDQGLNGIRTRDLRDTGAMLYQLSVEGTHWERGQLIVLAHSGGFIAVAS